MYNPDDLHEQDWEHFQPDHRQPVPTERMLQHIQHRVGRSSVKRIRYAWMAAASVLILAGFAGLRHWNTKEKPIIATATPAARPSIATRKTITNTTSETQLFLLPDGSKVKLAIGSRVTFDSGFTGSRRDLALTGEATFTVARDQARPFTVHSKDIAVTALGTVFGVDDTHSGFTSVLLYSGKVVVKKEAVTGRSFADVYLSPGQQLTVNRADLSVRIRMVAQPKSVLPERAPATPQQIMTFTRQPLAAIFGELRSAYHITITYDTAVVKNMDFTGTFNSEKEPLGSFLSTLCSLNDLTLKKTRDGFSIHAK